MANQTQGLLISIFFLSSSYAYSGKSLNDNNYVSTINSDEIIAQTTKNIVFGTKSLSFQESMKTSSKVTSNRITISLENVADNSQITKYISTNVQGADTKTYRIKRANESSKAEDLSQTNRLNQHTMKWEAELKSIELLKSDSHNSISSPKLR